MVTVAQVAAIRRKFEAIRDQLDERGRRLFAAAEVRALGHGGVVAVAQATGIARSTIGRGLKDLDRPALPVGRVRRGGCGQRPLIERDPTLLDDLRGLLAPLTIGDPIRPLLWVSKSHDKLAASLREMGHQIGPSTVAKLLRKLGYSRQCNSKVNAGSNHVDRDAQFEHINARVRAFQADGMPVISVDTKKKELIGQFKQPGTDYRPEGKPLRVSTHDYPIPEKGKVVPYGIYDIGDNSGWVSVGIDHDTSEFAVNAIRTWWKIVGCIRYPGVNRLMITADGGGSNGARVRLWKIELQKLADELAIDITVCHYPPGTSKWNKIEHRLFCHISQNFRARPLTSRLAVVELIAATTTKTGLTVACVLDERSYEAGIKVSDAEMDTLNIVRDDFHPEWNYAIKPREAG